MSGKPGALRKAAIGFQRSIGRFLMRSLTLVSFDGSIRVGPNAAGENITEENSLQLSGVFACVRVLAESVASLPLKIYQRMSDGSRAEAPEHPMYRMLHDKTNSAMTSFTFREVGMTHLGLWGNMYAEIQRNRAGVPVALWPIKPNRVTIRVDTTAGATSKRFMIDGGQPLGSSSILHIPGLGLDGYIGLSPIGMARNALGLSKAAERFGSKFFANDARPGGVLQYEKRFKDAAAAERLRNSFESLYRGVNNSHRVAVLEDGVTYKEIGVPPEDAQFLQTRKFQLSEIARMFRVPPHMIGDLDRATFSNIEQQSLDFVINTLRPWLVRIEQTVNSELFPESDGGRYFCEFSVDGLLRGDVVARNTALQIQRQNGIINADEWRAIENQNPLPDGRGTSYLMPLAFGTAGPDGTIDNPNQIASLQKNTYVRSTVAGTETSDGVTEMEFRAASRRSAVSRSYRDLIRQVALRTVKRERGEIIDALKKHATTRDATAFNQFLDEYYRGDSVAYIRENFEPVFRGLFAAVSNLAADEVSVPIDTSKMAAAQKEYVDRFLNKYAARSRRQLQAIVRKDQGDFVDAIRTRLDQWVERRPDKISGEERVEASGVAAMTVWAAVGYQALRWVTQGKTCPMCQALNGKITRMSQPFVIDGGSVNGEGKSIEPRGPIRVPPLHAGCDCGIVPA